MLFCKITVISVLVVCFFMPHIHERYAFMAEMLLLILAVCDTAYAQAAVPTLLCTLLNYCTDLYETQGVLATVPGWGIALIRLGCICWLMADLWKHYTLKR